MQDSSGMAYLTTNLVELEDTSAYWTLHLELSSGMNWEEWSTQDFPTSYRDDVEQVTDENENWTYYLMTCGTYIGSGNREGSQLELIHSPSNNFFAFQFGEKANSWNSNFGASTWALGNGSLTDIAGDTSVQFEPVITLIFDIEEDSSPTPEDLSFDCNSGNIDNIQEIHNSSLDFFPNPVNTKLNISLPGNSDKLEILSLDGKEVQLFEVPQVSIYYATETILADW